MTQPKASFWRALIQASFQRLMGKKYVRWESPQALMKAARAQNATPAEVQNGKRQTRYARDTGPMYFLGQQIVRQMQMAGRDAKISECFRSFEKQANYYAKGRTQPGNVITRARPGDSAHQYFLAVDIIHPSLGWDVPSDYWDTLASCVRIVAEKYNVELNHGHDWRWTDSAHIEIQDWRVYRDRIGLRRPTYDELQQWFAEVLPKA